MIKIVQAIQIGDNVTDIMRIPAIKKCEKVDWEGRDVLVYFLQAPSGALLPAQKGWWLVETETGHWHAFTETEYKRFLKNNQE